jgi:hypothetical protein
MDPDFRNAVLVVLAIFALFGGAIAFNNREAISQRIDGQAIQDALNIKTYD